MTVPGRHGARWVWPTVRVVPWSVAIELPFRHLPRTAEGRCVGVDDSRGEAAKLNGVFTGIVEELGEVVDKEQLIDAARFVIRGPVVTSDAGHGDSIAVNGVCLTVVEVLPDGQFTADVMAETLNRSSLQRLAGGVAGQPGTGCRAQQPSRRPHRAGPRRRHRNGAVAYARPSTGR